MLGDEEARTRVLGRTYVVREDEEGRMEVRFLTRVSG